MVHTLCLLVFTAVRGTSPDNLGERCQSEASKTTPRDTPSMPSASRHLTHELARTPQPYHTGRRAWWEIDIAVSKYYSRLCITQGTQGHYRRHTLLLRVSRAKKFWGSASASVNKVTIRGSRLVPRWWPLLVFNQLPRPTQPGLPFVGTDIGHHHC